MFMKKVCTIKVDNTIVLFDHSLKLCKVAATGI